MKFGKFTAYMKQIIQKFEKRNKTLSDGNLLHA